MSKLDDLDVRWLPAAARRAGALVERVGVLRGRVVGDGQRRAHRSRSVRAAGAQPGDRGFLRSLDTLDTLDVRYATTGPLAVLRDVPQLGFVVIGLVFLAATGTAVSRDAARNRLASQQIIEDPSSPAPGTGAPRIDAPGAGSLGPQAGDAVSSYLAAAASELRSVGARAPDQIRLSLVSFSVYANQQQAVAVLSGLTVLQVYLRAPAGGKDAAVLATPVEAPLTSGLAKAYVAAARGRRALESSYQGYVDTLTVTTQEDRQFKDDYRKAAAGSSAEALTYEHDGACVYAAVVSASPTQLLALSARSGVRSVQLAGAGLVLKQLQVSALQPDVTGVVPPQPPPSS